MASLLAMAVLTGAANCPGQEGSAFYPGEGPGYSAAEDSAWGAAPACGAAPCGLLAGLGTAPSRTFAEFYVDYRVRRLGKSYTAYEFGDIDPAGASPLSQLKFPLNSTWNGLEIGLEDPRWVLRAEWLAPLDDDMDAQLQDRDWLWQLAGLPPSRDFSNLGIAAQRWIDGQMADVALELKLWESDARTPVSLWPVGGFRWQKFEIMGFNLSQLKAFRSGQGFIWLRPPLLVEDNAIDFRQEYSQYYVGGQLHIEIPSGALLPGAVLKFQGDWAHVEGNNFDHHLLREGVFITRETTSGDAWHVAASAEILFADHFTVGVEGEYTQIRTAGSHHFTNEPLGIDQTWTRGVHAWSNQTAVTVFLRLRF